MAERWTGSRSGSGNGKSVISLSGEFFGVIFKVVRGFEGELMESPRTKLFMDSFSERDRMCDAERACALEGERVKLEGEREGKGARSGGDSVPAQAKL